MEDARVVHARPELFAPPNYGFAWIRMIGAILVIYGHSSPLVGSGDLFPPEWPVQYDEGVLMGFFALSGFQITESWRRDPHPARFAAKRVLRLWPPMLTVSLGMALIVGPLVTVRSAGEYFSASDTWGYLVNNAGLLTLQHDLPGVFANNPWPNAVNGSLWTLPMELLAYGGLYVLLLCGAAKASRRWLAVLALVVLVLIDRHLEHAPGTESAGSLLSVPVESLVAFLVAFAIGVVLNCYRIPLSPLAAGAALVVFLLMPLGLPASFLMAIAISYAVIVTGHFWPARLEVPGVWVNGSYGVYVWSFPVQQMLAMVGIANQYAMLLCAAPIAYVLGTLSWVFVEEPTMRLRHYITPQPPEDRDEEDFEDEADWDEDEDFEEDWDEDEEDWDDGWHEPVAEPERESTAATQVLPPVRGRHRAGSAEAFPARPAPAHPNPDRPTSAPPNPHPSNPRQPNPGRPNPAQPSPARPTAQHQASQHQASQQPAPGGRPQPGRPGPDPRSGPQPVQQPPSGRPGPDPRPGPQREHPAPPQPPPEQSPLTRRLAGSIEGDDPAAGGRHAAAEQHNGTPRENETRPIPPRRYRRPPG